MFKKMLRALGVGGPSVETVLDDPEVRPGLPLRGRVDIVGGDHDVDVEEVTIALVARAELETEYEGQEGEAEATVEFFRVAVAGAFRLAEGQELSIPFEVEVPWETPLSELFGQHLDGMGLGVRTGVSVDGALDKGDRDALAVRPLPVQERILEALDRSGFRLKTADLEYGQLAGVGQTLPFYQEIEFYAGPAYEHAVSEVELSFVADADGVTVVLELDKHSSDAFGRYRVAHADADEVDWDALVDGWLREAIDARHGG